MGNNLAEHSEITVICMFIPLLAQNQWMGGTGEAQRACPWDIVTKAKYLYQEHILLSRTKRHLTTSSQLPLQPALSSQDYYGCNQSYESTYPDSQCSCRTLHLPARNGTHACRLFVSCLACHVTEAHVVKA